MKKPDHQASQREKRNSSITKLTDPFAQTKGITNIPKPLFPGLIPTLNKRGFMEEDLNDISRRFVEESNGLDGLSLDMGCAYGVATLAALQNGLHVLASDMDQAHLDILIKETPKEDLPRLKTKKGTLPEINFKEEMFTTIHCSRTLHFLMPDDLKTTLTKMYTWLRPKGKVYFVTDTCFSGPWQKFLPEFKKRKAAGELFPGLIEDVLQCLPIPELPSGMTPYMNCLDPETLARECRDAGFKILESTFLGFSHNEDKDAKDHAGVIAIKN